MDMVLVHLKVSGSLDRETRHVKVPSPIRVLDDRCYHAIHCSTPYSDTWPAAKDGRGRQIGDGYQGTGKEGRKRSFPARLGSCSVSHGNDTLDHPRCNLRELTYVGFSRSR
ncbi:hypothetical protein N658DRAFT_305025 [Parathielavia hyrcaniae]|uniref:Uncharacterized protein n=1 Tax=Parathielavia hyrcaniae TaxID=113614 RepID=A0AAN6T400_9PEZI|nr:hypothetical protein N658DRAFT_305025 [Parathielavia hyrcaniae]